MKSILRKMVAVFCLMIAMVATVDAQNSFAYQAVIRSANGDLVSEKQVSLRFSLKYNDEVVYSETHKTTTNKYGSVQVKVGEGQKVSGDFAKVPWHTMQVMMQIEVDPAGGDSYSVNLGAIQLQPAPYAMHAASTGLVFDSSSPKSGSGALFEVKDKNGNPVFAVFPDGVRVYVDDADGKPIQTGFAVAGRRAAKDGEEANLFSVTNEGTRVTVDDSEDKPMATGFAVAGRRAAKDGESDLFTVSSAGTQIYLDTDANGKPMQTGFAVAGRRAAKDGENDKYLEINSDGTHVYIDDEGKPIQTGFAVAGRRAAKGSNDKYLEVTADGTKVFVDANGKPIQTGFAVAGRRAAKGKKLKLFEVNSFGTHIYIDEDADGDKPIQTGFAVAGRRAAKDGDHEKYVVIDADGTIIYVDYEEAKAMQTGFAVAGRRAAKDGSPNSILTVNNQDGTRVYIDDSDSNRNDGKAMQTGFAVAGRRAAKDGEHIMQVTDNKASMLTQRLSIEDKQSNKSMMEMNTGGTAIKTENFVVAKEEENAAGDVEEVNVFQATPDQGVQIASESKVVVKGDLAKAMKAEAITATGNMELPEPINVDNEIKTVLCKDYAKILGEVSGYKLLKIRGNGLFTENQTFDNDGNAVIMFNMYGIMTQESRTAAVVVILTNSDSPDDAELIIWPCRQIDNLRINFGLMDENSKGKYLSVEASVRSKGAVTNIELLSNKDEMGTVELDGTPAYNSIVSAVPKPKPGYEFDYWGLGDGQYEEWINEETGEPEGGEWYFEDGYRYSNPLYFAVGFEPIKLTAVFKPIDVWYSVEPFEGGKIEVRQKITNTGNNGSGISEGSGGSISGQVQYMTIPARNEGDIPVADFPYGDSLIFVAIPETGYKFAYWSMGWNDDERITDSILNIKVEHSMELIAHFELIADTKPFGGKAAILPGVIEAENFDEGIGAFSNVTPGTSWQNYNQQHYAYDIPYRTDNNNEVGIDSVFAGGEYALSFTGGEWYDYTVHVDKAQQMRWAIRYANHENYNAQISITRDYELVTGAVDAELTPGWWVYHMVSGVTESTLPAGDYKLRLNFSEKGSNVDKVMFGRTDEVLLSINIEYALGDKAPDGWMPMGTVTGYGFYSKGDNPTIEAVPDQGYRFVRWSDGVKTTKRTIENLAGDTTIVAFFCKEDDEIKEDAKIQVMTNGEVEVKIDGHHHNPDDVPEQIVIDGVEYYIYTYSGDCNISSSVTLLTVGDTKLKGWYGNYGNMDFSEFNVNTQTPAATSNDFSPTIGQTMNRFVALYEQSVQQEQNTGDAKIMIVTNGSILAYKGQVELEFTEATEDDYKAFAAAIGEEYNDDEPEDDPENEPDDELVLNKSVLYVLNCKVGDNISFKTSSDVKMDFLGWWDESGPLELMDFQNFTTEEELYAEVNTYLRAHCLGGYEGTFPRITYSTEFTLEVEKNTYYMWAFFNEENREWASEIDGIKYFITDDENKTCQVEAVVSIPDNGVLTIPANVDIDGVQYDVTSIANYALYGNSEVVSLIISEGVKRVDYFAFCGCENLQSLSVPSSLEYVADDAFGNNVKLTYNKTDDGAKYLGNSSNKYVILMDGKDVEGELNVESSCKFIHSNACSDNGSLTKLNLSSNIKGIGSFAFLRCSSVREISVPSGVESIGYGAFSDCGSTDIYNSYENAYYIGNQSNPYLCLIIANSDEDITDCEIHDNCKFILNEAFSGCSSILSLNVPETVMSIGERAFEGITIINYNGTAGYEEQTWGALVRNGIIDDDGFIYTSDEKTELMKYVGASTAFVIPGTVTAIGTAAFINRADITSVTIPNSVTSIDGSAFYGCTGIKSIDVPESVETILWDAFYGVGNINYNGDAGEDDETWGATARNAVFDGDFMYSSSEKTELLRYYGDGGDVTIPNTVATIGKEAFKNTGITSITIPASVTKIEKDAFQDCQSMTSARFASVEALCTMTFMSEFSNPMFPYDPAWDEDPCEVALYFGNDENPLQSVEIPTTVDSVGQYAFINCRQLTSVSIPSNVKTLGNEAFARCVNLSSVTIAEGSGENGLQELKFKAFNQCGFTTIVLPNTLTTIGDNAFDNCDYLASVTIPASVTSMGEYVFSYIDETDTEIICLKSGEGDEARFSKWPSNWYVSEYPHTITVTK